MGHVRVCMQTMHSDMWLGRAPPAYTVISLYVLMSQSFASLSAALLDLAASMKQLMLS